METPTPSAQGRTSSDPSPGEPIAAPPTVPMHADATSKSTPRPATHPNATASASNALLPSFDSGNANFHYHIRAPSTGLTLQTDFLARHAPQEPSTLEANAGDARPAASAPIAIQDQSYLRTARSSHSIGSAFSPSSLLSSPMLNALGDITPLPSPLVMSDSPGPWQRGGRPRSGSRDDFYFSPRRDTLSPSPSLKKKGYERLKEAAAATHVQQTDDAARERNRSISDYTPDPLQNPRPRHVTIGNTAFEMDAGTQQFLHRELYLAAKRGLIANKGLAALPTPPASNASTKSVTDTEEDEFPEDVQNKYIVVRQGPEKTKSRWRQVRQLGQGTFSTVYLATSERTKAADPLNETTLDPRKLVAIKMVEHGPAGGADEERVELSLKREVEMLQSVSHPSLVHLQAFDHNDDQALIVLTYCPGGDLFDVASDHRDTLTADLVQRVFAEMVSAVRYLHSQLIVHRDIKLENVLLNIPVATVPLLKNPQTHPHAIATLTDLGLSRRIPAPPQSPLLSTRCGSEDYAAPEILLGQPYDGRATDAWALGVLLYALMEGRLPFDPLPGKPARSRAVHRIARCDWVWVNFGDEDGEWDAEKGKDWTGARECVEGLLKKVNRGRKSVEDLEKMEWVKQGIQVEGGLKSRPEDEVAEHNTALPAR